MHPRIHFVPAMASLAAALLWIGLAWRSPTSTHHFAPLVIAGAWGYLLRSGVDNLPRADAIGGLAGGVVVSLGAQAVLTVADKLRGPELIPGLPVPAELVLSALLGAAVGSRVWRWDRTPAPE